MAIRPADCGSPLTLLSGLKSKFQFSMIIPREVKRVAEQITRHTYMLDSASSRMAISFLHHQQSGKWYVDEIKA